VVCANDTCTQSKAVLQFSGDPVADLQATIDAMRAVATEAASDPLVVAVAKSISGHWPMMKYDDAFKLYRWLKDAVVYEDDPEREELVRWPPAMLEEIATSTRGVALGDCDDRTVLGLALAKAMGIPGLRVRVLRQLGRNAFHHVYWSFTRDGKECPVDPQVGIYGDDPEAVEYKSWSL